MDVFRYLFAHAYRDSDDAINDAIARLPARLAVEGWQIKVVAGRDSATRFKERNGGTMDWIAWQELVISGTTSDSNYVYGGIIVPCNGVFSRAMGDSLGRPTALMADGILARGGWVYEWDSVTDILHEVAAVQATAAQTAKSYGVLIHA